MQDRASDAELRKRRAEELRSEIDEVESGGGDSPPSPREFTDRAAAEAAEKD
jgi:hypothetical protein